MWKWNLCTTMVHHNVGQGTTPASKPLWFPTIKSMSFCWDYWIVPTCIKQDCKERSNDCQPKFQNILLCESHAKLASRLFDMLHGWKVSSRNQMRKRVYDGRASTPRNSWHIIKKKQTTTDVPAIYTTRTSVKNHSAITRRAFNLFFSL